MKHIFLDIVGHAYNSSIQELGEAGSQVHSWSGLHRETLLFSKNHIIKFMGNSNSTPMQDCICQ